MISQKARNEMICKVNRYLNKRYRAHPTLVSYHGLELKGNCLSSYLKSISASCVNYLLYGRCVVSPERSWEYINWMAQNYEEPEQCFNGCFGVSPDDERTMTDVAEMIAKGLFDDDKMKFADDAKRIVDIMSEVNGKYQ